MRNKGNGLAVAGFVVAVCAALMFAGAMVCLVGGRAAMVWSMIVNGLAGAAAVAALVFSGIGNGKSRAQGVGGAGLSMAGLLVATSALTLVIASVVLLAAQVIVVR